MCVSAIALTSVDDCMVDVDSGSEAGGETASPTALPGTSIQIMRASCQPISTTSNRLTNDGKVLLTALTSKPEKFDQFALEIIFNEAIKSTLLN